MKQKKRHSLVSAQVPSWRFFDTLKIFIEKQLKSFVYSLF